MQSTCGDARSTGAASLEGCALHLGESGDDAAFGDQPGPHPLRVRAVGRRQGGDRRSARRPARPPAIPRRRPARCGSSGPARPAARGSARDQQPDVRRARPKGHACSDIGFTVLQPLHHRERQVPFRRRQPRPEPFRQRRDGSRVRRHHAGRRSICVTRSRSRRRRPHSRCGPAPARRRLPAAHRGRGTHRRARAAGWTMPRWLASGVRCTRPGGLTARTRGAHRWPTGHRRRPAARCTWNPFAAITARFGPYSPGRQARVRGRLSSC